jgi:hypothetical protein
MNGSAPFRVGIDAVIVDNTEAPTIRKQLKLDWRETANWHMSIGLMRDFCVLALVVFAMSGCINAPVQEMSDARQAVEAAAAADAADQAPEAFITATAHIQHAETALQHGNYKDARQHAIWAKLHALEAREEALAH